ncbi:hypothetical protein HAX54_040450, partial [Datura stramonium]|nr:hypothetical protein [Datura stramonium]
MEQSSLDNSKLTGTTRVLAYSSFTGVAKRLLLTKHSSEKSSLTHCPFPPLLGALPS